MKLHLGSVHKNKVVFTLMKIVNLHPENLMKYVRLLSYYQTWELKKKWMNSIWVRMEPVIIFTLSLSTADIVPVIHRLISIRCKIFWSLSLSLFRFICSFKHISCNSASLAVWFIVNFTDGDARAWSSLYIYHFRWHVFFLNSSCFN